MLGIREEGGRDPNERPDNQNDPEDTLEGVAISLTSANDTRRRDARSVINNNVREQYRRYPINSPGNNANVTEVGTDTSLCQVKAIQQSNCRSCRKCRRCPRHGPTLGWGRYPASSSV